MRTTLALTFVAALALLATPVVRAQGGRLAVVTITAIDGRPRAQSEQVRDRVTSALGRCVPRGSTASAGPTAKLRLHIGPTGAVSSVEQLDETHTGGQWRTCTLRALRRLRLRPGASATIDLRATWALVALGDVSAPTAPDSSVEIHTPPVLPASQETVVAQVRVGTVAAEPSVFPRDVARRVVRAQRPRLLRCYEQAIRANPELHGTVSLEVIVTPRGTVAAVHAQLYDLASPVLPACLEDAARAMAFPPPAGGATVRVRAVVELFLGPSAG